MALWFLQRKVGPISVAYVEVRGCGVWAHAGLEEHAVPQQSHAAQGICLQLQTQVLHRAAGINIRNNMFVVTEQVAQRLNLTQASH